MPPIDPNDTTSAAALSAALQAPAPAPAEPDPFDAAFANFATEQTALRDGTDPVPLVEAPAAPVDGDPAKTPATPPTAEEQAALDAAAAAEAAKVASPEPKDDPIARLADILTKREPPQPQQPHQRQAPAPLYSQDEVVALQNFYKEWPEVAQAQELALKGFGTNLTNRIFAEVANAIAPKLALIDELARGFQTNEIRAAVPDLNDALLDQVQGWTDKQPSYLKAAYTNVMQNGTADEVADLIHRFRQETGQQAIPVAQIAPAQPGSPGSPPPASKVVGLSDAAKQAAAKLAPVATKRSAVSQGEPQTFEDAFDVAAAALATSRKAS